jgi:hypothetical protein
MVIIFSLFILAVVLLPALSAPRLQNALNCANQLKHIGLAFREWEGKHGDKYPMGLSVTNGGTAGLAASGNAVAIFQAMSNDLASTRILVCPADKAHLPAASFRSLTSKNISYFINLDAPEANPQAILSGDDNLTIHGVRVKSGLLVLSNNTPLIWGADRHRLHGNLGLADGSVQSATDSGLAHYLSNSTNGGSLRLAIP